MNNHFFSSVSRIIIAVFFLTFSAAAMSDDAYEENDLRSSAYPLSQYQAQPLSSINGFGISSDEDWYEIEVTAQFNRLKIDVTFQSSIADIDLVLYNSAGTVIATSYFGTDIESIDIEGGIAAGKYYIQITSYGGYVGAQYNLYWSDVRTAANFLPDAFEPNESFANATPFLSPDTWLSDINGGFAISATNDDLYEIAVPSGNTVLSVTMTHIHAEGNLNFAIYNSTGTLITSAHAFSLTDNEFLEYDVGSPGTYYIQVYMPYSSLAPNPLYTGQYYNLFWSVSGPMVDDNYELATFDLTNYENVALTSIQGSGISNDVDIYKLVFNGGFPFQIQVDLTHNHADGDLDMRIIDNIGTTIAESSSLTDNEQFVADITFADTYFILIDKSVSSSSYSGQSYNLVWSKIDTTTVTDDLAEENDSFAQAFSVPTTAWVSDSNGGQSISNDEDWYQFTVPVGQTQVWAYLEYTFSDGNLELDLVDDSGSVVAQALGTVNNDEILFDVSTPGNYYLRVYNDGTYNGQTYNVWLDVLASTTTITLDDNYEENDDQLSPYILSSFDTQLSTIAGSGVSNDQDWYEINVTSSKTIVQIDLTFSSAVSDLDLSLYDTSGNQIAFSWDGFNMESINVDVINAGVYHILVDSFGGYAGASYDMTWSTSSAIALTGDDAYEENDSLATAYDLTRDSNTPLSDISGPGASFDEDWYQISVSNNALRIQADLLFKHTDSDLDFELYDASGTLVVAANTATDNEAIDITVGAAGSYYLRVITFIAEGSGDDYTGALYNMGWTAVSPNDAQAATTVDTVSDTSKGILGGIGGITPGATASSGGGSLNGLLLVTLSLIGLMRRFR